MATMLMTRTSRARSAVVIYCHDQCDPKMAPSAVKSTRRQAKRSERRAWKKEANL